MSGPALVEAANALVGSPFRLYGRDPATGLDCLGVVLAALAAIGHSASFAGNYGLRMTSVAALLGTAEALGFQQAAGPWQAGDVLLFAPGGHQHHLGVACGDGRLVHAHAGLGRVVCAQAPAEWAVVGHWRLPD